MLKVNDLIKLKDGQVLTLGAYTIERVEDEYICSENGLPTYCGDAEEIVNAVNCQSQ